jgi:hypothetical protein
MLPAVATDPATATLPAVAIDPATAMLPAVAIDPATAMLPAVASDPATAMLSGSVGGSATTAVGGWESWMVIRQFQPMSAQIAARTHRHSYACMNNTGPDGRAAPAST